MYFISHLKAWAACGITSLKISSCFKLFSWQPFLNKSTFFTVSALLSSNIDYSMNHLKVRFIGLWYIQPTLYDTSLTQHLHAVNTYSLHSLAAPRLEIPKEVRTFEDSAARSFNDLPDFIRCISNYNQFIKLAFLLKPHEQLWIHTQKYSRFTDNWDLSKLIFLTFLPFSRLP